MMTNCSPLHTGLTKLQLSQHPNLTFFIDTAAMLGVDMKKAIMKNRYRAKMLECTAEHELLLD